MDTRTRCQIAELVGATIAERGLAPRTQPFMWMADLFAPLFERDLPMNRTTRQERKAMSLLMLVVFPMVVVCWLVALPLDLWRIWRIKRHNRRMNELLGAVPANDARGYRDAPGGAQDGVAALRRSQRLVALDFRIIERSRFCLCGSALVGLGGEEPTVGWLNVHRSAPRDAEDAQRAQGRLSGVLSSDIELLHLEWDRRDPYEQTERPARPW